MPATRIGRRPIAELSRRTETASTIRYHTSSLGTRMNILINIVSVAADCYLVQRNVDASCVLLKLGLDDN